MKSGDKKEKPTSALKRKKKEKGSHSRFATGGEKKKVD